MVMHWPVKGAKNLTDLTDLTLAAANLDSATGAGRSNSSGGNRDANLRAVV
jgi:hypothetical protein